MVQWVPARKLATYEDSEQRLGRVVGLDVLSSAAYGPEAALAVLIVSGLYSSRKMPEWTHDRSAPPNPNTPLR
jgi:hypothetical protein